MRKVLVLLAGLLMAITVASPPAGAITGDYVEDDEHPFVGLVAFYDATATTSSAAPGRCCPRPSSSPPATARRSRPAR